MYCPLGTSPWRNAWPNVQPYVPDAAPHANPSFGRPAATWPHEVHVEPPPATLRVGGGQGVAAKATPDAAVPTAPAAVARNSLRVNSFGSFTRRLRQLIICGKQGEYGSCAAGHVGALSRANLFTAKALLPAICSHPASDRFHIAAHPVRISQPA